MATDWSLSLHTMRDNYLYSPHPYDQVSEGCVAENTLAAYEQAIQLAPHEAVLYYHKARALEELGRTSEAQQTYEEAQKLGYFAD